MDKLISVGKAADLLGVTTETLRQWEKQKILECQRTKGGHRRYLLSEIEKLQGKIKEDSSNVVSIYCRVSSHEQKTKGDLKRQKLRLLEYCSKKKYQVETIYEEVGSGMSATRRKMNSLFNQVIDGNINKVVIEYKDRLTRFNFEVVETLLKGFGVEIECVEKSLPKTFEAELVEDMLTLVASFSAKIYGRRSAERRKKKKEQDENSESI